MERIIIQTKAFQDFYKSLNARTKKKVDYIVKILRDKEIVSAKFVKKLVNTEFYEMRISTDNEYRTIIFAMDNENITNANKILLLNGFIKKSTSDYSNKIAVAKKIIIEEQYGKD
ncbi:MAG: type II toxin-antitoxin system RelE/ParE family toxin [Dysgonamonadaceae bacterium]|jgi:hypothetical protein|nr:type II toxin-antitoxin system RelE/ParE family toxin [Dysgonamonadaceae bacterium]